LTSNDVYANLRATFALREAFLQKAKHHEKAPDHLHRRPTVRLTEGYGHAKERWPLVIPYAVVLVLFIWLAFDYFMAVPWPPTLIGEWFPMLKAIPSV